MILSSKAWTTTLTRTTRVISSGGTFNSRVLPPLRPSALGLHSPLSNRRNANGVALRASSSSARISKTRLRTDLKEYRTQQSAPLGKPPYTVFTNAVIEEIYTNLPTTLEDLLTIKGIGPKKLDMFGTDILSIVSQYTDVNGQPRTSKEKSLTTTSKIPRPTLIDAESLTTEQRRAADLLLSPDRPNVFVSGQAGTGKSYVLRFVVQELQRRPMQPSTPATPAAEAISDGDIENDSDEIFEEEDPASADDAATTTNNGGGTGSTPKIGVCAPTGVAAIHVGGSTLHSFFGIGLGTGSMASLVQKVKGNTEAQKRIDETDALIIDECSMLSSDLMETLDEVVRQVRKDGICADLPFGGMQIICFGDFFQLPPISRGPEKPFCFDSPVWAELGLNENMVELQQVMRQDHVDFVDLLNKVRVGQINHDDIAGLNARCVINENHPLPSDGIVPTRLYSLNRDVDAENETRLVELEGKELVCSAYNKWKENMPVGTLANIKKQMADGLSKEMPDEVRLKVGAQVMLTRNKDLDRNLVNGSRGVVIKFERSKDGETAIPWVRFDCGVTTAIAAVESVRYNPDGGAGCLVRSQIPLKLAWAITVHKSQGATLTRAMLDISSAFEYGQCYVALSRVRSLEGLWLVKPARLHNIKVSPQVLDFYSKRELQQQQQ